MDEFELQSIRIRKEDSVVAIAISAILCRGVQHRRADRNEESVHSIDIRPALGIPGKMMQATGKAVMFQRCVGWSNVQ